MPALGHSKLTPQVEEILVSTVKKGNYLQTAFNLAGISKETFYTWLKRGENGEEPFLTLLTRLKEAEAKAEVKLVENWQKEINTGSAGFNTWQAIATFMERRWRDRWGRSEIVRVDASPERAALASALKDVAQAITERKALPGVVDVEVVPGDEES